jgi:Tfp pilus assembly protein PilV
MSLLEAVVATVILALVGVACLEGTQRALVLQQRAEQRTFALQQADAGLTAAALGVSEQDVGTPQAQRLSREPYRPLWAQDAPLPVERVSVQVQTPDGRVMQLTRLVPRSLPGPVPRERLRPTASSPAAPQ